MSEKPEVHILVVGDIMLDIDRFGVIERICPEGPVPIIKAERTEVRLGGAGAVAKMCSELGADVTLVGAMGLAQGSGQPDESNQLLQSVSLSCLRDILGSVKLVAGEDTFIPNATTTSRTRFYATVQGRQEYQLVSRIDRDMDPAVMPNVNAMTALRRMRDQSMRFDAIIIADHGLGVIDQDVVDFCQHNLRCGISDPLIVDPCRRGTWDKYRSASIICPNRTEVLGENSNANPILVAAQKWTELCRSSHRDLQSMIVKLDRDGVVLIKSRNVDSAVRFPSVAKHVVDVTGAGDQFVATLAVRLASCDPLREAIHVANVAAGLQVGRRGAVPVKLDELNRELEPDTLETDDHANALVYPLQLSQMTKRWKEEGEKIVFTCGCFDLFHEGHLTTLEEASRMGTKLVVAVNDDRSVAKLKGEGRPIHSAGHRAELIANFRFVDAVVVVGEEFDDVRGAIDAHASIFVKGADSKIPVIHKVQLQSAKIALRLVDDLPNVHTTSIIRKIARNAKQKGVKNGRGKS